MSTLTDAFKAQPIMDVTATNNSEKSEPTWKKILGRLKAKTPQGMKQQYAEKSRKAMEAVVDPDRTPDAWLEYQREVKAKAAAVVVAKASSSVPGVGGTPQPQAKKLAGVGGTPLVEAMLGVGGTPQEDTMPGVGGTPLANSMAGVGGTPQEDAIPEVGGTPLASSMAGVGGTPKANTMAGVGGTPTAKVMTGVGGTPLTESSSKRSRSSKGNPRVNRRLDFDEDQENFAPQTTTAASPRKGQTWVEIPGENGTTTLIQVPKQYAKQVRAAHFNGFFDQATEDDAVVGQNPRVQEIVAPAAIKV